MKVEISIDRSCICEKSTLGTQQENKFEKLEFTFPEEIKDYAKTIEFQTPESKFIDKIENNEYIIKNNISKYECVQVQIIAKKEDKVFKSKIFDLYFYKSINATEEIPEEQPDLIHKMVLDIKELKEDISNFSSYDDTELQNKIIKLEKEKALLEKDLQANQITDTVDGESLALTDCSSARLVDFGIEGSNYQAVTENSPSPDCQSEIKSCGDNGNITIIKSNNTDKKANIYQEQSYTVPTQKPFRAIGDVKDRFIKQDGKWYEEHKIRRYIFSGNENWNNQYGECLFSLTQFLGNSGLNTFFKRTLSNMYKMNYVDSGIDAGTKHGEFAVQSSTSSIFFKNTKYSNVDDWKSNLTELYNKGTPLYIDYVLKTQKLIKCTQQQSQILDELANSENYKGLTYIYGTDEVAPNLKATYSKDLNTIIKKLQNAITPQTAIANTIEDEQQEIIENTEESEEI